MNMIGAAFKAKLNYVLSAFVGAPTAAKLFLCILEYHSAFLSPY
jgi:hypothetical protein